MKIMLSSDAICLLSGLLSRQRENERCPHSQILSFFLHCNNKCAHMSYLVKYEERGQREGGGVDIQRKSIDTDLLSEY